MFTSSGSGSSSGGSSQSHLISMAMAEATKLFDSSGGASNGNKQDVVNSAAMTVVKLLVKSKFSGTTGGSNSGGLGSMMSLVSATSSLLNARNQVSLSHTSDPAGLEVHVSLGVPRKANPRR